MTFDSELMPGDMDETGYILRYNDYLYTFDAVTTEGHDLLLEVTQGAADVGDDIISYDGVYGDVRSRFGQQVVTAFTDFPLT